MGSFLAAVLVACTLAATACSSTNHKASATRKTTTKQKTTTKRESGLEGCVYVTDKGISSVLNLYIADQAAAGAKGSVEFTGAGLKETENFVLNGSGDGHLPFTVTTFNAYHFAIDLTKPKLSYQMSFSMNPNNDVTTSSCTPK